MIQRILIRPKETHYMTLLRCFLVQDIINIGAFAKFSSRLGFQTPPEFGAVVQARLCSIYQNHL